MKSESSSARTGDISTRSQWLRRLRGYFFFKPIALILVFLVLPPEIANFNFLVPKAQAASVTSQTVPHNCVQTGGNNIIQLVCQGAVTSAPPTPGFVADILAYETDSIKQHPMQYNLPHTDSDVAFVYQYARTDLRSAIRAYMEFRMIDIAYRGPYSPIELNAYKWYVDRLQQHETDYSQAAVDRRNAWQGDRCGWKIDPDIAQAYGIHYVACVGALKFNTAPNKDYFFAAAHKKVYDNILIGPPGATPLQQAPQPPDTLCSAV